MKTTDIARAAGCHPNTVRRYVERGWLPPVQRGPNGYRQYTQHHLDCMRVARLIYSSTYPGRAFRASASRVIRSAVVDDWRGAIEAAHAHLALVQAERAQAETAATLMEQWASGTVADVIEHPLRIGQVATLLGVSMDMLRNWEHDGLILTPRQPGNGYRAYGAAELGRLRVIRMLSRAGYSLMSILRMMIQLDRGQTADLRRTLDTPAPDEDVYSAADRWLTTLAEQEQVALRLVALIKEILQQRTM